MCDSIWTTLAVVIATVAGPILAVRAQKIIERWQAARGKKEWVFHQLMAHRAAQLSPNFVMALNSIDIAFNSGLPKKRTKAETEVMNKWRETHHELGQPPGDNATPGQVETWQSRVADRVTDLLEAMAKDLGYSFDREILRSGGYYTKGAAEHEGELRLIRQALVRMTTLHAAVPVMNVQPSEDGQRLEPVKLPR